MPATLSAKNVFQRSAFSGRVYGVTGAAHGIGERTARHLASLGACVLLIDLNEANLARVKQDLEAERSKALFLHGDVTDSRFMKRAINGAVRRWGRLDGWVNNAMINHTGHTEDQSEADFRKTWEVNTLASWRASQMVVPHLKKHGGAIVNLSSIRAHYNVSHDAAYGSAKAGIEGLTRAMAIDLAPHRIRVNAILPGMINTFRTRGTELNDLPPELREQVIELRRRSAAFYNQFFQPWPRIGEPEDIGNLILYLLSDASEFITGASFVVDGGATITQKDLFDSRSRKLVSEFEAFQSLRQKVIAAVKEVRAKKNPSKPSRRKSPARKK